MLKSGFVHFLCSKLEPAKNWAHPFFEPNYRTTKRLNNTSTFFQTFFQTHILGWISFRAASYGFLRHLTVSYITLIRFCGTKRLAPNRTIMICYLLNCLILNCLFQVYRYWLQLVVCFVTCPLLSCKYPLSIQYHIVNTTLSTSTSFCA